jgi:uncharacterized protein
MKFQLPEKAVAVALRVGIYCLLAMGGLFVFGWAFASLGTGPGRTDNLYVVASALSVFAAAALANALALRIYEGRGLADAGFPWNTGAARNLALGLAGGITAALFVTLGPILESAATLEAVPGAGFDPGSLLLLTGVLLLGGIGEEMLFHGYGFQVLMAVLGPFATILPVSVLFALAHGGNLNVSGLALFNTGLWGAVLGFAFWRSGDLWLPIGLHVGWNWVLPLFGANLSGFTMRVTGYAMRWTAGPLWSGGEYGPEGGVLTTAAVAVLLVWLAFKAPVRRQTPYLLREHWDD